MGRVVRLQNVDMQHWIDVIDLAHPFQVPDQPALCLDEALWRFRRCSRCGDGQEPLPRVRRLAHIGREAGVFPPDLDFPIILQRLLDPVHSDVAGEPLGPPFWAEWGALHRALEIQEGRGVPLFLAQGSDEVDLEALLFSAVGLAVDIDGLVYMPVVSPLPLHLCSYSCVGSTLQVASAFRWSSAIP